MSLRPRTPLAFAFTLALAACGGDRASRPPLDALADSLAAGPSHYLPCQPVPAERQAELAYGGHQPVESCRIAAADTTTILLRSKAGVVMSVVRAWQPGAEQLDSAYAEAARGLERTWGEGTACPENDRRGAVGERIWSQAGAHVRLQQRPPAHLVVDYELGPGTCEVES